MVSKVEVFVLSYNRSNYLRESLRSLQNQTFREYKLIVSDNSSNDEVEKMLMTEFPHLEIRRRRPSLTSESHFNTVLSEARAEYVMIFHDDDQLHPNGLERMMARLAADPSLAAVGGNAFVIEDQVLTRKRFSRRLTGDLRLSSPPELLSHYIQLEPTNIPFPSYLYRRKAIEGLRFNSGEGRKYLDVSFLLKVSQRGPMVWLAEPVMNYRFHTGNDSGAFSLVALNSLMRYLQRQWDCDTTSVSAGLYQLKHHLFYFRQKGWNKKVWSHRYRRTILLRAITKFFSYHPSAFLKLALFSLRKLARSISAGE